jgi:hypothetical protein
VYRNPSEKKVGANTVRVRIPQAMVQFVSAANTAFNTVSTLTPLAASEATTYSIVYDTARCRGFWLKLYGQVTTTANGVPTNAINTTTVQGLAYDASNNGSYASVEATLIAENHWGPYCPNALPQQYTGGGYGSGMPGKWSYVKIPKPVVDPGLVTDLLDSNWVSSKDTGVVVGYLKPYLTAAGAATSSVMNVFVIFDMEFTSRS